MGVIFAQVTGQLSTRANQLTPIPGLNLTIPEGVGEQALVILNVPGPYSIGSYYPDGWFGIAVNGIALPVTARFVSPERTLPPPGSFLPDAGRTPTTLVAAVPLANQPQGVVALWGTVNGAWLFIDSSASLSAII